MRAWELRTKRALLQVHEVLNSMNYQLSFVKDIEYTNLLDVLEARRANENSVSVLSFQQAVMRYPTECDFRKGKIVLICNSFD